MSKKRTAPPPAPSAAKLACASDEPPALELEGLLPDLSSYIQLWLSQDIPSFDVQGCVAGSKRVTAHLLQKSPCILAGRPFFDAVFAQLGCRYVGGRGFCFHGFVQLCCSITWHAPEGSLHSVDGNRHVATVTGPAHAVLKGERTAPPPPPSAAQLAGASDEPASLQLEGLLPDLSSYIQLWLSQDIPSFDVQGCVAGTKRVTAHLLQKSPCILAGRPFFDAVFAQLGCR